MSDDGLHINLRGMDDAVKQMERIKRGSKAMARYTAVVYSRLPYAWGQEFGSHRVSGKLARKSGGAHYITGSIETVLSGADSDLSEGLNKVTAPGTWVLKRLALWARRLARENAPRKRRGQKKSHNYRLWRSIGYQLRKK